MYVRLNRSHRSTEIRLAFRWLILCHAKLFDHKRCAIYVPINVVGTDHQTFDKSPFTSVLFRVDRNNVVCVDLIFSSSLYFLFFSITS